MKFFAFLKDWSLPISMLTGAAAYFIYTSIPQLDSTHAAANTIISYLQPGLIFAMLFVSFCKIRFSELRLEKWHFVPFPPRHLRRLARADAGVGRQRSIEKSFPSFAPTRQKTFSNGRRENARRGVYEPFG